MRPVAEGIAGGTISTQTPGSGNDRSYLMSLCEAGQQSVMVTGVYKKNVELMFLHANTAVRYLEDVVTAQVACDKTIEWSALYVVDKAAVIQQAQAPPSKKNP